MNRQQAMALAIAAVNLALVLFFPPYDYLSMQRGNVATFDGFHFALAQQPNRIVNGDFLALEIIVVLANAGIAWLLLRSRPAPTRPPGNRYQRGVLWLVAINLVLMLLFPPFENYAAITKAAVPTFEGFYFLFADNSQRQIVTTILYLEVALALINGGLLWLLFKERSQEKLSAGEIRSLARKLRETRHP
ncbi:MAG: hypothetical protein Q8O34_14665 [Rhodocyclaceae bacterium]|nr:hypothetical protein [Rhodocyclaceae bacterium]